MKTIKKEIEKFINNLKHISNLTIKKVKLKNYDESILKIQFFTYDINDCTNSIIYINDILLKNNNNNSNDYEIDQKIFYNMDDQNFCCTMKVLLF